MLIELHLIQNFAPANLNRDDTNSPKECEFGGVRRARISSQCIKRAIRTCPTFSRLTGVETASRTKTVFNLVKDGLVQSGKDPAECDSALTIFIPAYLSKLDTKSNKTAVLLYLSKEEVTEIAGVLSTNWAQLVDSKTGKETVDRLVKELTKKNKSVTSAPDIALFGRMLAEKPVLGLEAACQVAHAISTHRVTMEMDYYTAVDDKLPEEETGAGMMGFIGFNSACFYRYACIDWQQLVTTLHGDKDLSKRTVQAFLQSSIEAIPTGKQASFAAHNLPGFALMVVRNEGSAWSLANAFEKPVRPDRDGGFVNASIKALDTHWGRMTQVYGTVGISALSVLALDAEAPLEFLRPALKPSLTDWMNAGLACLS